MRRSLQAFWQITARWRLTQSARRTLLGLPTDERWFQLIRDHEAQIAAEEFSRLQVVVQLDTALSFHVSDPCRAARWLRTLQPEPPFLDRTPLALASYNTEDFKAVLAYLQSRRPDSQRPKIVLAAGP
jgi:hypothetical protein